MKLKKGKAVDKMANGHTAKNKKKKKNIAEVTTDDFFNQDFENMELSSDEEEISTEVRNGKPEKSAKKSLKKPDSLKQSKTDEVKKSKKQKDKANKKKKGDEEDFSDSGESDLDPAEHKKSLMKLQETDPEFFNYLKNNDNKLLDFNVSDEEGGGDDDGDDLKHIPDDDLEIASDDSDYEPEDGVKRVSSGGLIRVTLKLLKSWEEEIQNDKSSKTIKSVVEAFHAALETISDSEEKSTHYKVEGGAIFNGIIQLCMMHLPQAFKRFLKIEEDTKFHAHKCKRFPKIKGVLKSYLSDLIQVFQSISSPNIVTVLLKHLHQMLPFSQSFSSLRKPLLRILLKYWSTAEEETVRVVAFLCIVKIATTNTAILTGLQKTMYIKYVENSKFVSPTTLPGINFMRRSLTEIYLLDTDLAYHNAFLYIRQLAIHLRNALTLKKKENFQSVYNWQFINSLWFWSDLIPMSNSKGPLRQLTYPLVQVIIGVIKLIPTSNYFPLRFHCVRMLINVSREANVFIPILPFLLEILDSYDFNKKHKAVSMKPTSLMCLLKVSKSQAQENGYKDAIIEHIYELILENAAKDGHTIHFPDQYIPCVLKLKEFLKKCHVANYCRKLKQLLDKIEENRKFIDTERARRIFDLRNLPEIEIWEHRIKEAGTPANKYFESWIRVHQAMKLKLVTQNDETAADFKVPTLRKQKRQSRDDDEDSDLEIPVEEMDRRLAADKEKKKKKKMKKAKVAFDDSELPTDNNDIVTDIKSSDWD